MKNKSEIKNIMLGTFAFVTVILLITFFINLLIISKAPFEVAQDNDWIGFWGSVLGSSIGGVITFVTLKITINHENKIRICDIRMNILPVLDYKIVCDEYIKEKLKTKRIEQSISDVSACLFVPIEYRYTVDFKLAIENIGINKAIKPRVRRRNEKYSDIGRGYIEVGDNMIIHISEQLDRRKIKNHFIELNIQYYNLRMELYCQDVTIKCEPINCSKEKDLIIATGFYPNVVNISEPIIINDKFDLKC